jgi:hypothetical protein
MPNHRRALAIGALLLASTLVSFGGIISGSARESSGLVGASSSSTPIVFSVVGLNQSGFTIDLAFSVTLNLSGGPVTAGQNLSASATLYAPSIARLNLSYSGKTASVPVPPLGSLRNFSVSGLNYSYEGIVSLGLVLNFSGVVLANSSLTGPATGGSASLSWNKSASYSLPISVRSDAKNGSVIQWSVTDLAYNPSIGIDASGVVLGHHVTIPLMPYRSAGSFPGDPSSSAASYTLPGTSSGGNGGGPGGGWGLLSSISGYYLWLAVLIVIVVVVAAVALHRRNRKPN